MAEKWALIHDLLGGTSAMRAAGETWLPKEPSEQRPPYEIRLNRSILYGGLRSAISRIVSKPFSKPVTLQGELPERLESMQWDMDREGTNLAQFGRAAFDSLVTYGLTHFLVDYPAATGVETLEEERAQELRPFVVHVKPPDVLRWTEMRDNNGARKLTEVRIKERQIDVDPDGAEIEVEYVRIYTQQRGNFGARMQRRMSIFARRPGSIPSEAFRWLRYTQTVSARWKLTRR